MIRTSFVSSFAALSVLTLGFGCTPPSDGGGDGEEEQIDEGPPSSYADNGYPNILDENADYTGDGSDRRDFIHTFDMVDQHGNRVDFRQFLGYVTILDVSAEWCPPCRAAAETAQEVSDAIQALGPAYYVQVISQDNAGEPAVQSTAARWSNDFDLDLPVLADEGELFMEQIGLESFPTFFVVRPTGEIDRRQGGALSDQQIVAWVEYLLDDEANNLREIPGWPDPDAEHDEEE